MASKKKAAPRGTATKKPGKAPAKAPARARPPAAAKAQAKAALPRGKVAAAPAAKPVAPKASPARPSAAATKTATPAVRPARPRAAAAKSATPAARPAPARPAAPAARPSRPKPATKPAATRRARAAASPAPEQEPAALAKLAVSKEALASEPKATHIPWAYGLDRVTAAAVDPDQLFTYWEATDLAIDRARAALGPGGPGAWLNLRVYDTSGLIFDGTNAHGYFDHSVDRATRQWFFHIGKPTSSAFVELGLKSSEGFFVAMARSGRVDFPRRQPAPWNEPEWMTVVPWSGEVADVHRAPPGAAGSRHAPPPGGGAGVPDRFEQIPLWVMREPGESYQALLRQALEQGWERVEWQEATGEGWFALEGRVEWESPHVVSSWEAGPFSYPVEIEAPSREEWTGRAFAYRVGGVTHVVYGPWRVVIRNLGGRAERAVHGAWTIHRSWAVEAGHEIRPGPRTVISRPGASEQLALGASERRWLSGSEARLGGASEAWRAGASELAYRGASEQLFLGASQWLARGASERQYAGASEARLGGASERQYAGASERQYAGASEARLGGASEQRSADDPEASFPYPAVPPAPPSSEE